MRDSAAMSDSSEAVRAAVDAAIRETGCFIALVCRPDTGEVQSGFTIGLTQVHGHPELFVCGLGEEETLAWLEELAANQPVTFDGNAPIVDATDAGEIQGGLVNHYYLLRLRAEGGGAEAENLFIAAGDVGSLVMPAGVGIIEGTDQPDAAGQFVDFLLSEESQEYFATETFEFPVIDGVELGQGMPDLSEIVSPDIDLSALADVLEDATRLVSEAGLV